METSNTNSKFLKLIIAALAILLFLLLASSLLMWQKLQDVQAKVPMDPEAELASVVGAVGKLLVLPQDEKPRLLTLTDTELSAVSGQTFFKNALAGDKLLIYQNNSKAVIWRPETGRIIEASIINLPPGN